MGAEIVENLDDAQRRAIALLADVAARLEEGMSTRDVVDLASARLQDHGFEGWSYPPEVRIGTPDGRLRPRFPLGPRARVERGRPVVLALGPSAGDAVGDIGTTVVFGAEDTPIVAAARAALQAVIGYSSGLKCTGELCVYARTWAVNHGYALANPRSIGHALPHPGDRIAAGDRRMARWARTLRRNQVHDLNPRPFWGPWALYPALTLAGMEARFRELVFVGRGEKRVLGRTTAETIGTLPSP